MKSGRKYIWIYSSNIFFIHGVKALVAEVFSKRRYVIHVFDEKHILNITSAKDVQGRTFVFSDTKNPFFLFYLSLFCRKDFIPCDSNIEDVRRYLCGKSRKKKLLFSLSSAEVFVSPGKGDSDMYETQDDG
ncbi:TPA: hypothetical protein JLU65_005036 [Escherichia coli]|nr:hypothetical protein [Escherichia coli]HAW4334987.1 hypothetical protein [Escherichia coli]